MPTEEMTPEQLKAATRPTEKQFMAQVRRYAELHGWLVYHTHDSRRSASGFPDLVLVRERVIFAELKTDSGNLTRDQSKWLRRLAFDAFAETHLWRPRLWPEIERVLQ